MTDTPESENVKKAMKRRKLVVVDGGKIEDAGSVVDRPEQDGPHTDPDDPGFTNDEDSGDWDGDLDPDEEDDELSEERRQVLRECAMLDANDRDNGRRLVKHFGSDMIYIQGMGWLVWNGKFWVRDDGELRVRLLAQELVDLIKLEKPYINYTPDEERLLAAAKYARDVDEDARTELQKKLLSDADTVRVRRSKKRADREKFAIQSGNAGKTGAMIMQAASHRVVDAEKLDADRMRFNVRNGTLVFWREKVKEPIEGGPLWVGRYRFEPNHLRADLITKMGEVDYDPDATCPFFETDFLAKLQPDIAMRAFLQVFHGYAMLLAGNDEQKVAFHYGTGANGKSAFIEVLGRLAGTYRTVVGPETIAGDSQRTGQGASPDIARLHNARLATIEELPKNVPLKEDLIKALTGGTRMTARFLQKEFFEFEPIFTPIMSGNSKPMISGSDYGIWRRVLLVHWGVTVPEGERLVPSLLAEKLDAERSGILNWLITGVLSYLTDGLDVFIPKAIREFTQEYRTERDSIGAFAEQCIVPSEGGKIQAGPLYKLYKEWCELNALTPASQKAFGVRLVDQLGFKRKTGRIYEYLDIKVQTDWRTDIDQEFARSGRPPKKTDFKDENDPSWSPKEGI